MGDPVRAERSRWRRYLPWLVLLVGLAGLPMACSGVAMGGAFSEISALPSPAYWWRVEIGSKVAGAACLLLIVGAAAVLILRD